MLPETSDHGKAGRSGADIWQYVSPLSNTVDMRATKINELLVLILMYIHNNRKYLIRTER